LKNAQNPFTVKMGFGLHVKIFCLKIIIDWLGHRRCHWLNL